MCLNYYTTVWWYNHQMCGMCGFLSRMPVSFEIRPFYLFTKLEKETNNMLEITLSKSFAAEGYLLPKW